ncbi:MAG: serine protease [Actinomycetota bacterium]|jgi:subtilisin family serine protease|nr:serine protease [Actinomycetota bacterium]
MRAARVALVAGLVLLTLARTAGAAPRRDPLLPLQWGLTQVHAAEAWRVTQGAGVTVAVIDSGVDFAHPDLRGALLPGKDFSGSGTVSDDCGHGTQVAGVLAARAGNGIGLVGIAPRVTVLPLKDGASCTVNEDETIAAIRYAVAAHARVISLSEATVPVAGDALFTVLQKQEMQAAVDDAWAHGTLVVAGAGNDSLPICEYPAALNHVVCVGAVTSERLRAYYSQGGDATGDVDFVMAPGGGETTDLDENGGIWTTSAGLDAGTSVGSGGSSAPTGYESVTGTSFATPFVSGIAALLFSRGYSVQEVRRRLLETATDLGPAGPDPVYGYGEVDAAAALH